MKTKSAVFCLLMALTMFSCQKDFDPIGEYQESYAAYCLLNLRDTVQYVRINKIFLTKDNPAQYFQEADSVNIDPELMEVSLTALEEGMDTGEEYFFIPTDEFPKEDGTFSSAHYYVFKSPVLLESGKSYRLKIRNKETGFQMHAETQLLGKRPLAYSYNETRYYNINQYTPEPINYHGSLVTTQYEKRVVRLLYYEYRDEEMEKKYLDWRSPYSKSGQDLLADTNQLSDELMRYFGENIPYDPDVRRRAVGLDKMLIVNDELTDLYIDYYNNLASGQYIPDMTNFDQGTGLLASRYNYTYFAMKFKAATFDSLAYGRFTHHLGFADANGNWPPK